MNTLNMQTQAHSSIRANIKRTGKEFIDTVNAIRTDLDYLSEVCTQWDDLNAQLVSRGYAPIPLSIEGPDLHQVLTTFGLLLSNTPDSTNASFGSVDKPSDTQILEEVRVLLQVNKFHEIVPEIHQLKQKSHGLPQLEHFFEEVTSRLFEKPPFGSSSRLQSQSISSILSRLDARSEELRKLKALQGEISEFCSSSTEVCAALQAVKHFDQVFHISGDFDRIETMAQLSTCVTELTTLAHTARSKLNLSFDLSTIDTIKTLRASLELN